MVVICGQIPGLFLFRFKEQNNVFITPLESELSGVNQIRAQNQYYYAIAKRWDAVTVTFAFLPNALEAAIHYNNFQKN